MTEDEMKTLAGIADSMHKLAEGLETMSIYMLGNAGKSAEKPQPIPVQEPAMPQVTLEEVRAVLADKSAAGQTAKVRQLLQDFGAEKLSAVKPEEYAALKARAEVL